MHAYYLHFHFFLAGSILVVENYNTLKQHFLLFHRKESHITFKINKYEQIHLLGNIFCFSVYRCEFLSLTLRRKLMVFEKEMMRIRDFKFSRRV